MKYKIFVVNIKFVYSLFFFEYSENWITIGKLRSKLGIRGIMESKFNSDVDRREVGVLFVFYRAQKWTASEKWREPRVEIAISMNFIAYQGKLW